MSEVTFALIVTDLSFGGGSAFAFAHSSMIEAACRLDALRPTPARWQLQSYYAFHACRPLRAYRQERTGRRSN